MGLEQSALYNQEVDHLREKHFSHTNVNTSCSKETATTVFNLFFSLFLIDQVQNTLFHKNVFRRKISRVKFLKS